MSGHLEQTLTMNESLCKQEYQFHHALIWSSYRGLLFLTIWQLEIDTLCDDHSRSYIWGKNWRR
jgi:hypothetical protein